MYNEMTDSSIQIPVSLYRYHRYDDSPALLPLAALGMRL
jgi:hypothetical protein